MLTLQPSKSPQELISHIETTTNVIFSNIEEAEKFLKFVNYNRLKPYIQVLSKIKPNIDFLSITHYYEFERDLKRLAWNAIERIEVGVKRAFISQITGNELWYCNINNYKNHSRKKSFKNTINLISKDYIAKYDSSLKSYFTQNYQTPPNDFNSVIWDDLKEILLKIVNLPHKMSSISINELKPDLISKIKKVEPHLRSVAATHSLDINITNSQLNNFLIGLANAKIGQYTFASFILFCMHVPFYLIVEKISFGALQRLFDGLDNSLTSGIINEIFINLDPVNRDPKVITSCFKKIVTLRNSIAHHDNLFNNKDYKVNVLDSNINIKIHLLIVSSVLDTISDTHTFIQDLQTLASKYVSDHNIDTSFWGL